MKPLRFLPLVAALAGIPSSAHSAVVQTLSGPFTDQGDWTPDPTIVGTGNDTGNWIDSLNAGSTYYIGFDVVMNDSTPEDPYSFFMFEVQTTSDERTVSFGIPWDDRTVTAGYLNLGVGVLNPASGINYAASTDVVPGTPVRLVFSMTYTDPAANTGYWSAWVNPDDESSTPLVDQVAWDFTGDVVQFDLRAGAQPNSATASDVIVATTLSEAISAVPEPTSGGLLALLLGSGTLFIRRRQAPLQHRWIS